MYLYLALKELISSIIPLASFIIYYFTLSVPLYCMCVCVEHTVDT